MSDVIQELQQRVTQLEEEVRQLKAQQVKDERPWWEKISGTFADDPTFADFKKELARQRREDYRQANEAIDGLEAAEKKAANKKPPSPKARGRRSVANRTK